MRRWPKRELVTDVLGEGARPVARAPPCSGPSPRAPGSASRWSVPDRPSARGSWRTSTCDQDRDDEQRDDRSAELQVHPPEPEPQQRKRKRPDVERCDLREHLAIRLVAAHGDGNADQQRVDEQVRAAAADAVAISKPESGLSDRLTRQRTRTRPQPPAARARRRDALKAIFCHSRSRSCVQSSAPQQPTITGPRKKP